MFTVISGIRTEGTVTTRPFNISTILDWTACLGKGVLTSGHSAIRSDSCNGQSPVFGWRAIYRSKREEDCPQSLCTSRSGLIGVKNLLKKA